MDAVGLSDLDEITSPGSTTSSSTSPSLSLPLPLMLSIIAGGGTFIGGVFLLILIPTPPISQTFTKENSALFGRLQALSAGVMLILSINLLIESVPKTGYFDAVIWLIGGAVVMYLLEMLIPEDDLEGAIQHHLHGKEEDDEDLELHRSEEGSGRGVGERRGFLAGAANGSATSGPSLMQRIQTLMGMKQAQQGSSAALLARTGFVTYLGLALHNLPEGISVAVSTASSVKLGISLCVAIMLHNLLEGMVVALPLWYGTANRFKVLLLTLTNGMMEPLGVLIVYFSGGWYFIDVPGRVDRILCGVAGVMGFISLAELVPSAAFWMLRGRVVAGEDLDVDEVRGRGKWGLGNKWVTVRIVVWTVLGAVGGWIVLGVADWILTSFGIGEE
ncbi:hypothetical protein HDU76_011284 [Blyttiomyces sp. JEL0837]|nr:hypothetical protein HDU76_011284 [Blyttiomyces sp. JEL0837]